MLMEQMLPWQSKDFIFMLIVWEEILRKCNALSKQLQTVNMDMIEAIDLISLTKGALQVMRSDDAFKNRYEAAKEFSGSNDVVFEENHEATRRVRRRKKFFDDPEGAQEVVMTDSDKQKVNYFEILDHIATEMEERFEHFHCNISKFSYLSPKRIMSEEAVLQIEALAECYDGDVDASRTVSEFKYFQRFSESFIQPNMNKDELLSPRDILKFMAANKICPTFPNVSALLQLCVILPVSSACAERSFSRMTHLRSTMEDCRLTNLMTLRLCRRIEVSQDEVIDRFATMKKRRKMIIE